MESLSPLTKQTCRKAVAITLFLSSMLPLQASRLMEVRQVDENILMVHFRDGAVVFRDDGTGPTAHDGFIHVPGDDQLVPYGKELDVKNAVLPKSWRLTSEDHEAYVEPGLRPIAIHRKAKVNNADHEWDYKLDHWIYLELPKPLQSGATYVLHVDRSTHSEQTEHTFDYHMEQSVSPAIHVNLVGYTPDSPVKAADLYLWMGDAGARDYSAFEGNPVWIRDFYSGERWQVGTVEFWKKSAPEAAGRNMTGSNVWSADFSNFTRPGTYQLVIEGVGSSEVFKIRKDLWHEPYRVSLRGYYYMRISEPITELRPIPRQPRFIEGKDPENFVIYITDLDPYDPHWKDYRGDTYDEPSFKPARESMFWKRRLPGNPTNPNAYGGHSDALDWDRKLPHSVDIYDLLLPYIMTGGLPGEDDLGIRESGNGIPDLIDEARNQVDFFLRLRVGEAYAHGLTNPSWDRVAMFQSGPTTTAAWANAANCAILADAFRISGHDDLMEHYRDEAINAYRFAQQQDDLQLDAREEIGEGVMRGRDFRMMAAAFLYNITGDTQWEDAMAADSVVRDTVQPIELENQWSQTWGTAAYLFSTRNRHYPELADRMRESLRKEVLATNLRWMSERPSRRSSGKLHWQTAHNLQHVMLAHSLETDPVLKEQMLRAMILEADWGLGRNPSNLIEMTGMGPHSVVNAYTSGRNDGSPGLHPGHTPYHSFHSWGGTHNGNHPKWFAERGYPDWDDGWPFQEAHFNSRYCWSNSEFTPRETMRGKMALYAYLHALHKSTGND